MGNSIITSKQFQSYAKRCERVAMKENGESLTVGGIASRANEHIIEVRDNGKTLIVRDGWKEAMRAANHTQLNT